MPATFLLTISSNFRHRHSTFVGLTNCVTAPVQSGDCTPLSIATVAREMALLTFQSIAEGHRFEFHPNGVCDGYDRASFEREGRQHRTELMYFEWVVTFH